MTNEGETRQGRVLDRLCLRSACLCQAVSGVGSGSGPERVTSSRNSEMCGHKGQVGSDEDVMGHSCVVLARCPAPRNQAVWGGRWGSEGSPLKGQRDMARESRSDAIRWSVSLEGREAPPVPWCEQIEAEGPPPRGGSV